MKRDSLIRWVGLLALPLTLNLAVACGDDDDDDGGSSGSSGSGSSGKGGSGGSAGSTSGSGGSAGSTSGSGGSAGSTAGSGGSAGSTAGSGGSAGSTAGSAGEGGSAGSTAGSAGEGGSAGSSAGSGGSAGDAGSGGSAGGSGGDKSSLFFTGTGFTPHDTQLFRVVVLEKDTQTPVANVSITGVQNGFIGLSFPNLLTKGKTYTVNYYADLNQNGTCDPPSADHVWTREVTASGDETELTVTHDTNWTDVCSTFAKVPDGQNLTVKGSGFDPHNGQVMAFAVVGKANDNILAGAANNSIVGGAFSYTWHGLLTTGKEYTFNYYADLNNSKSCDAPPNDHVWTLDIPTVTAPVSLDIKHNTEWTDVCKYF